MLLGGFELTGDPPWKRDKSRARPKTAAKPPPSGPAQLDPPERPVDIPDGLLLTSETLAGDAPCLPMRHTGWAKDRARIHDALASTDQPLRRIDSFDDCGHSFWVLQSKSPDRRLKIVAHRCHDRFCIPCGNERVEDIRRNLSVLLGNGRHRFLTLTIRSDAEPLTDLLDHLLASFRRLRQTTWWSQHVAGGAAFLEIKYNPGKKRWHPHLHCIVAGKFMPARKLSHLWQVASRGSFIVDIRLIHSKHEVLNYATRYVTKPLPRAVRQQPKQLAECVVALKGRRLIITFGEWHHWRLTQPETEGDWSCLGKSTDIYIRARLGESDDATDAWVIISDFAFVGDYAARDPP